MDTASWLSTIVDYGLTLLGLAAGTIGVWLGLLLRKYLSTKAIQVLQSIFNAALENAAGAALNQLDPKDVVANGVTDKVAVGAGVTYLKSAIPDTIAHFKLSDNDLEQKVIAMINKLLAIGGTFGVIPPVVGAVAGAVTSALDNKKK